MITVALRQIGELVGVTRRSDELVPCGEKGFGERSAKATGTALVPLSEAGKDTTIEVRRQLAGTCAGGKDGLEEAPHTQ